MSEFFISNFNQTNEKEKLCKENKNDEDAYISFIDTIS